MAKYPWEPGGSSGKKKLSPAAVKAKSEKAATSPLTPKKALVRLGYRLSRTKNPDEKPKIRKQLANAFVGYEAKDVRRIGREANLKPVEINALISTLPPLASPRAQAMLRSQPHGDIATLLDVVNAPQQAALGGLTEGPGGAWRGLTARQQYTPIQSALRVFAGQSKREAGQTEAGLNPWVRTPVNIAGSIATDPLTYLTLGQTALAKGAVRSAAPAIAVGRGLEEGATAARLAEQGTLSASQGIRDIAEQLGQRGLRALTREERKALPRTVKRGLRMAPGGVNVMGRHVPGSNLEDLLSPLRRALGRTQVEGTSRAAEALRQGERAGSTFAAARQYARADQLSSMTAEDVKNLFATAEGRAGRGLMEDLGALKVTRKLKPDELGNVRRALENPDLAAGLTAKVAKPFGALEKLRASFTHEQVGAGWLQPDEALVAAGAGPQPTLPGMESAAPSAMTTERYFPRIPTDTELRAARGAGVPPPRQGFAPNLQAREEATRFAPTETMVNQAGEPRFVLHPGKAVGERARLAARDVANARLIRGLQDLKDNAGNALIRTDLTDAEQAVRVGDRVENGVVAELPVTHEAADGTVEIVHQKVIVHPAVAPDFERVSKFLSDESAAKWLEKALVHMTSLWKGYATVFGPFGGGFALRNLEGNLINGFWLTNTNPIPNITKAFSLQRALARGTKEGDLFKYLSSADTEIVRGAIDRNVLSGGFFHDYGALKSEAEDALRSGAARAGEKINPLSKHNILLQYGGKLNSGIEENSRLALYIGLQKKGYSPDVAGRLVQKYLFNYNDLSTIDENIKKFIPFFTWTRKNVPLQLETLATRPGKITTQAHILQGLRSASVPYPTADIPEWQRENDAVILPFKVGGEAQAFVPDIPITSTYDTLRPLQDILSPVVHGQNPLDNPTFISNFSHDAANAVNLGGPLPGIVSALLQVSAGREVFSGRPFQPGGQVKTPSYLSWVPGVPSTIPREIQFYMEQIAPGLAKVRSVVPTDPSDKDKQTRRLLSIFTGQSIYPLNKRSAKGEAYRRLELLQAMQKYLADRGTEIPQVEDLRPNKSSSAGKYPWGS